MKTFLTSVLLITIFFGPSSSAQTDTIGWGRGSRYNRMYNPNTVTDIEGTIIKMEHVAPMTGMSSGVHLTVNSNGTDYSIHVGPQWYLDKNSFTLNENDKLKITGSKVNLGKDEVIIAQQITKEKATLELRDKNGVPNWSMGRRGKRKY